MSQVLTNSEIARLVAGAILKKEEGDVTIHILSDTLIQVEGYTPDKFRMQGYVLTDDEMTDVRVSFLGKAGLSFGFKIFSDEATPEKIMRYIQHYLTKHENHVSMMPSK